MENIFIFQNHLKDDISYYKRKLSKFSSQNIILIKLLRGENMV